MEQLLDEWCKEAGFDPEQFTVEEKQKKLFEHYQTEVNDLEEMKKRLDNNIQELIS